MNGARVRLARVVVALALLHGCKELNPDFVGPGADSTITGASLDTTVSSSESTSLDASDVTSLGTTVSAGSDGSGASESGVDSSGGGPGFCGDGMVDGGEQCDDANMDDTDACVAGCISATCGDGFVQTGIEQCDDADTDNADECIAGCLTASCGDGFAHVGVEACDGGDFGGQTCNGLGQPGGALVCDAACAFDTIGCVCGMSSLAVGGECPVECTGGCDATTCTIECNGSGACSGDALACPAGWDCNLTCAGTNACENATLMCSDWACAVSCQGNDGCAGAKVTCGAGTCAVTCGQGNGVCGGLELACGANDGSVTCTNGDPVTVTPFVGSQCACAAMGC